MSDRALRWAEEQLGAEVVAWAPLPGASTSTVLRLVDSTERSSVLRLVTREPWRTHGPELVAREATTLTQLQGTGVPAPGSIAVDLDGARTGHPAHLVTHLPGVADLDRAGDDHLDELAQVLVEVHAVRADPPPRTLQPWAFEATYVVPAWAADPAAWERAFDVLREPPPSYDPVFLHRDFQPCNVLWHPTQARVSGVVDWVETSTGPAWLDVAHCSTHLALDHGGLVADRFAEAYAARSGVAPAPWWDVMDVVGFLPRPGTRAAFDDPDRLRRLDDRLRQVVERVRAAPRGTGTSRAAPGAPRPAATGPDPAPR